MASSGHIPVQTLVACFHKLRDNGFEPVYAGNMDQSIRLEVFGDLHEFGAIGKPVTLEEANRSL